MVGAAKRSFQGHTSLQMSQPKTYPSIRSVSSSGMGPFCSIVRYEMHRVASSTRGATKAPVGQASRQRVHEPQRSSSKGRSVGSARSVKTDPMKKKEPAPGRISIVFLPIHPNPARRASSRSGTGPASAKVLVSVAPFWRRKAANSSSRRVVTT